MLAEMYISNDNQSNFLSCVCMSVGELIFGLCLVGCKCMHDICNCQCSRIQVRSICCYVKLVMMFIDDLGHLASSKYLEHCFATMSNL